MIAQTTYKDLQGIGPLERRRIPLDAVQKHKDRLVTLLCLNRNKKPASIDAANST